MPTAKRIGADALLTIWGIPCDGKPDSEVYAAAHELGFVWDRKGSWVNPDECPKCGSYETSSNGYSLDTSIIGDWLPMRWEDRECGGCHHSYRVEYEK